MPIKSEGLSRVGFSFGGFGKEYLELLVSEINWQLFCTCLKECTVLYLIGSPTGARTWDLRINRCFN